MKKSGTRMFSVAVSLALGLAAVCSPDVGPSTAPAIAPLYAAVPFSSTTTTQDLPVGPAVDPNRQPSVLMLGMGWFPSTLGGLDRYFRSLFEQLPSARAVVIGPAERAPASVTV